MNEHEALEAFFAEWHRQANEYGASLTREQRDCAEEAWHAALAWLRSQGEPVAWEYRTWYGENTVTPGWSEWLRVEPRNPFTDTVDDRVAELKLYIERGYKYEVRPLFLATQPGMPDGWLDRGKAALAECRAADDLWSDDRLLSHLFNAMTAGRQSKASRDVLAERRRQVEAEGWTPEHDDAHGDGSMCMAAVCYAEWDHYEHSNSDGLIPINWPWSAKWWKPKDPRRDLVRAAALILAEIERLDRRMLVTAPEPSK